MRILLGLPPGTCYQAFCDAEKMPEWVPGVVAATAIRPGPVGPLEVKFQGTTGSYTLLYFYDANARRVGWMPRDLAQQGLRGYAAFATHGRGCEMSYAIELGDSREEQAVAHAQETLERFRAWLGTHRTA